MDEKDWLILKTLYEQKSITKTAASLFISQPALSSRLQHIEARFGTIIVVRSNKGVQFTPEGEYLVRCSYEMLKKVRSYEENIQNMREQPAGTLRIGASNFCTKYILPELLRLFKVQYPNIEFKVTTGWSKEIAGLVYNNDVHIGFVKGDYSWTNQKILLQEEKMYVSYRTPFSLINLPRMPRIDYQNEYEVQALLDKWWNENFSVPPRIGMEVDKVDTCQEMVYKGLGYAFLPGLILRSHAGLYNLEMLFKSGNSLLRRTWLLYNKETMELKLGRAFFDFVKSTDFMNL